MIHKTENLLDWVNGKVRELNKDVEDSCIEELVSHEEGKFVLNGVISPSVTYSSAQKPLCNYLAE